MTQPHEAPATGKDAFNCPHCRVYAHQTWHRTELRGVPANAVERPSDGLILLEQVAFPLQVLVQRGIGTHVITAGGLFASRCDRCHALALWFDGRLIWPRTSSAPPVNTGLPEDVKGLYEEAAVIAEDSPRGAAALLRLAVESLVRTVVPNKRSLNDCIADLVDRGLDPETQKALDAVRVIGNRAVHTEAWAVADDDARTVSTLFRIVNHIAETLTARPSEAELLYRGLPTEERARIDRRNQRAKRGPA